MEFSPRNREKASDFLSHDMIWQVNLIFFNPEMPGVADAKRFTKLLIWIWKRRPISCKKGWLEYRCNSSIRVCLVCLPDLCSFYLPAGCRGIGESLVGGIDVKMAFHRQRWNANRIVQHSILCLLPIRKFLELIGKYSDEVLYLIYAFLMLQGSVGIPFFFGSFPLLKFSLHWVLLYQKSTESSTHKSVDLAWIPN